LLAALAASVALLHAPRPEGSMPVRSALAPSLIAPAPVALPSPLTAEEEASPACARLARRFNPAMALPDATGPWPVSVSYSWSDGADLVARTVGPRGEIIRETVARGGASLDRTAWANLPVRDPGDNLIQYWVDGPGDDTVAPDAGGVNEWRRRWRAIAGDDPTASRFPPTQYAHLFWVDRDQGLLAVQYWFFFPFNEWINHHEGDWEHITVILQGPSHIDARAGRTGAFRPVRYQFFFHGWRYEPDRVLHAAHDSGGEHALVFTGGRGRFLAWGGRQSGGSYPLPARFDGVGGGIGPLRASDDTRRPARILRAEMFRVVVLPEPMRLDGRAHPELSWLRLPFFAGQPHMHENPPLLDRLGGGAPPLQPGMRAEWIAAAAHPAWPGVPFVGNDLD
jgi:hypothetical protein